MTRRNARRTKRELSKASVAAQAITSNALRKIHRLSWEADRSPSKLGRAGERAQQMHDLVSPAALTVIAILGAAETAVRLLTAYREYKTSATS